MGLLMTMGFSPITLAHCQEYQTRENKQWRRLSAEVVLMEIVDGRDVSS